MRDEECYDFITQMDSFVEKDLPDEVALHVQNCSSCAAMLEVSSGRSVEELRALWRSKEPERKAWERFSKDCDAWYETWRGKIFLYVGGWPSSRRARWLGVPKWEDYRPTANELSKPAC